jgi:AcrR family transcriptional regulator
MSGEILDAAQTIFAREGFQGTTIRAIAREAGCDSSLIYYHFENKESMLQALFGRRLQVLRNELECIADPLDKRHSTSRLRDVLQACRRHLAADAGLRATVRGKIVQGEGCVQDTLAEPILAIFQTLSDLMQQGIQRGEIREGLPPMLLVFFLVRLEVEILDLIPFLSGHLEQPETPKAALTMEHRWFDLFWRGIEAHPEVVQPGATYQQNGHP